MRHRSPEGDTATGRNGDDVALGLFLHLPASTAISDEEWVDSLNINFLAALRVTYGVLDELKKTKGNIITVSAGGRIAFRGTMAHYGPPRPRSTTGRKLSQRNWHRRACASTS